jgi:phosphodiester glycosidase
MAARHPQRAHRHSPAPPHLRRVTVTLPDGATTTVHVARHETARTRMRVAVMSRPTPLAQWCAQTGVAEALVGGFYVRPHGTPLGELRTGGVVRRFEPFDAPWSTRRACVHVAGDVVSIVGREELVSDPPGDLLQAGPLLVRDGAVVQGDHEGFSAGAGQFDSDITAGRYPRAALGLCADGALLAVACDGRADDDAGLTIAELAGVLADLGAHRALNLDGGGSASLVCAGQLANVPRESHGVTIPGGRRVSTALVFAPR